MIIHLKYLFFIFPYFAYIYSGLLKIRTLMCSDFWWKSGFLDKSFFYIFWVETQCIMFQMAISHASDIFNLIDKTYLTFDSISRTSTGPKKSMEMYLFLLFLEELKL